MKRFFIWMREFWRWLGEGKIVFMGILVLTAAIANSLIAWPSEDHIKWAGCALQILGTILAIWGLLSIRVHFRQPPFLQLFINWLKAIPKFKGNIVAHINAGIIGYIGSELSAEVWAQDDPAQPLEARIERIVINLNGIRTRQIELHNTIKKLEKSHEVHKKKAAEDNKALEVKFQSNLESLHTKDLIKSLVGLIWLITGSIMSTLPSEIFNWIR